MSPSRITTEVDGRKLTLSNLEKVLYPKIGFTKAEVIDYYARVAEVMLPHLRGRPVTLKRFPNGVDGMSFFEKHAPSHKPDWVPTVEIAPANSHHRSVEFALICNKATLTWTANLAAIELHIPLWRISKIDGQPLNPDFMVFDLDPGPGANIVECCEIALKIGDHLGKQRTFPKTSGSKGLQLYLPIEGITSEQATSQAQALARTLESKFPDKVVSNMRKELRPNKVLIDWSQNRAAKTTVAAYSLRAQPEPTVSTPVSWSEIECCLNRRDSTILRFTASQVLERIKESGDLFLELTTQGGRQTDT